MAGDFADFGLGAFGFLVGPALLDFLAFDGDFAAFAAVALGVGGAFLGLAAAAAAVAFLALEAAVVFFSTVAFFALGEAAVAAFLDTFLSAAAAAVVLLAAGFLAFVAPEAALEVPVVEDEASLKEPEAPFPFFCTRDPEATALFKYFLMKGATFSASTL